VRMIRKVEKRIDIRDRHSLLDLPHLHDFVTRAHFAFFKNAEVVSRSATGGQQRRHSGLVHPDANAIAGNSGLRDFEECTPDPIPVADAHRVIGQTFDCEIFAELCEGLGIAQRGPLELLLPIVIRLDLVDEDGAVFASVSLQVSLTVTVQIEPADPTPAMDRIFPDSGVHGATPPLDVAWETDVY
jgi:hypothetical protein